MDGFFNEIANSGVGCYMGGVFAGVTGSAEDRRTEFNCQIGQVRFMIYLPRLKFGCLQKCTYMTGHD